MTLDNTQHFWKTRVYTMDRSTEQPVPNPYASAEAEEDVRPLAAADPLATQRASAVGLVLWAGWLMFVLVVIVWLVG